MRIDRLYLFSQDNNHSVVLVAYVMLDRIHSLGRGGKGCRNKPVPLGVVLGGWFEQPGKAREGRRGTAFLGCKRRRGLGLSATCQ